MLGEITLEAQETGISISQSYTGQSKTTAILGEPVKHTHSGQRVDNDLLSTTYHNCFYTQNLADNVTHTNSRRQQRQSSAQTSKIQNYVHNSCYWHTTIDDLYFAIRTQHVRISSGRRVFRVVPLAMGGKGLCGCAWLTLESSEKRLQDECSGGRRDEWR